ncbi:P-loop containing nucleoside triphosphate hydrolase protein, partial [Mycena amicta]
MQDCFFDCSLQQQHIWVLYGLGGAGKTQIALKFIETNMNRFTSTFMVDSSTADTLEAGLRNIAIIGGMGDSVESARSWLTRNHESWLLLLDNADDPQLDLHKFIPQCNHGNIIITSRNQGLRVYGKSSHVGDLQEGDAIQLLLASAACSDSPENCKIALLVVKELCYLPLGIVQAGAYISKTQNLAGYLPLYSLHKAKLLSQKPAQSHDNYHWTVYTTWQMSFEKLSPLAAELLQVSSCLYREGISEDIFADAST